MIIRGKRTRPLLLFAREVDSTRNFSQAFRKSERKQKDLVLLLHMAALN